jgi:phage FluMu protein Com
MNIYDTKIVSCTICGKCIGEINFEATIEAPKCGKCKQTSAVNKIKRRSLNTMPHPLIAVSC